jgi:hypothetical protein
MKSKLMETDAQGARTFVVVFDTGEEAIAGPQAFDHSTRIRVALCLSDHADSPAPWEITSRHVYVRGRCDQL